ncbi:MAG: glycosyl transferase [Gammaproteobacteria bacterium]|nr:glycosyl transferase [Gammaproteobacteria bacterium]|tara:strand:+ start:318 stop:1403 length:1086 start_codon:yes stop_codon:yes gene_type:complete
MKIFHIETGRHFLGGPQQVIYLINALDKLGHDNTLICHPGSGIDLEARKGGIKVKNFPCFGDLDLLFAYRLSNFLKKQLPNIVHCHSRRGADLLGGFAAANSNIPAVLSRRVDNSERKFFARRRYKKFKKIIVISEAISSVLKKSSIEDEHIEIIRDAVDISVFSKKPDYEFFKNEFRFSGDGFIAAAAGQLIPRKGHKYLLQAIVKVKEKFPNFKLIIFGEGSLSRKLQEQVILLKLNDTVKFAGFYNNLDDFIGCFDLFIHPSTTEGLGVAVLKAAAAGVPVIASRVGGLPEAIDDNKTGLLIKPRSASEIQNAIVTLIENDELRSKYSEAGKLKMKKEFSISTMADKHVDLYESLICA